jgi:hypothetical protein
MSHSHNLYDSLFNNEDDPMRGPSPDAKINLAKSAGVQSALSGKRTLKRRLT